MPAWSHSHEEQDNDSWKLVLFIRDLRQLSAGEKSAQQATAASAHYTGSQACEKCHQQIYERWKKTPMANVVRDPREHPEAIIPDLATDPIAKFTKDQVALVYGSVWKQRYFTKIGDDYFPEPAQWDVTNRVWRPYFVAKGTDWWEPFYPADNMQRPTGPTCMAATPSTTTFTPRRSSSGTWVASVATVLAASTSSIPRAAIFSIPRAWTMWKPMTLASSAIHKDAL